MSSPGPNYPDLLPDHGRFGYEAIHRRPFYRWPDGSGLAVHLAMNLGHGAGARSRGEGRVTAPGAICAHASATLAGVTR